MVLFLRPFWISPRQAIVCSVSENFIPYAKEVHQRLWSAGFDVDLDITDKKLPKKVFDAQVLSLTPHSLTLSPSILLSHSLILTNTTNVHVLMFMSVDYLLDGFLILTPPFFSKHNTTSS
jgi:hypothetical protein